MQQPVALFALLLAAIPARPADPHSELLSGIRRQMTENLASLPNYTCRETIERSAAPAGAKKFVLIDRLRLEVAYVGGRELYAWPGAETFEDTPIEQMVGAGAAIGSGGFAMHARAVFTTNAPQFSWAGEQDLDGRKVIRFDFQVARDKSRYAIQTGPKPVIVAYDGYVDADAETLQPLTLHINAIDLPSTLNLRSASETVRYGRHRIGESEFLLPVSSELSMIEATGRDNRNLTHFEACKEYTGESTVKYDFEEAAAGNPQAGAPIELPANLAIEAALRDSIENSKVARGDLVNATVISDVKKAGRVLVPKGAVVTGRITRVSTYSARSLVYFGIGVRFRSIEFRGRHGTLSADVDSAGVGKGYTVRSSPETHENLIYVQSTEQRLRAGTLLVLRTH